MILEKNTLNNIANFISSPLINSVLKNEEIINEFSVFAFGKSKQELMMIIGATMVAGKNEPTSTEIIVTRKDLANKLREFLDKKGIEHSIHVELDILLDDSIKSASGIQRKYCMGFRRASKIYELYSSLF